jgi:hypothetical protein
LPANSQLTCAFWACAGYGLVGETWGAGGLFGSPAAMAADGGGAVLGARKQAALQGEPVAELGGHEALGRGGADGSQRPLPPLTVT